MTREEYFAEIARIHAEWSDEVYAKGRPMADTGWRDAAEHEVEAMATPQDESAYWAKVSALTKRYREEHPLP